MVKLSFSDKCGINQDFCNQNDFQVECWTAQNEKNVTHFDEICLIGQTMVKPPSSV